MRHYAVLFDSFRSEHSVIYQDSDKDPIWYVHGHVDTAKDAHILAEGLNMRAASVD